jgi:hypothetical protein
MIVYQVNQPALEYTPEGEDCSESYPTAREAIARAKEIEAEVAASPYDYQGRQITVERLTIARMDKRRLVIAILNRTGYVADRRVVWSSPATT